MTENENLHRSATRGEPRAERLSEGHQNKSGVGSGITPARRRGSVEAGKAIRVQRSASRAVREASSLPRTRKLRRRRPREPAPTLRAMHPELLLRGTQRAPHDVRTKIAAPAWPKSSAGANGGVCADHCAGISRLESARAPRGPQESSRRGNGGGRHPSRARRACHQIRTGDALCLRRPGAAEARRRARRRERPSTHLESRSRSSSCLAGDQHVHVAEARVAAVAGSGPIDHARAAAWRSPQKKSTPNTSLVAIAASSPMLSTRSATGTRSGPCGTTGAGPRRATIR